jgi:Domain of unknown function (DUF5110)
LQAGTLRHTAPEIPVSGPTGVGVDDPVVEIELRAILLAVERGVCETCAGNFDVALYDDDGETFDYERGDYSRTQLSAARDGRGVWQGSVTPDKNGRKWRYSAVSWTFMPK